MAKRRRLEVPAAPTGGLEVKALSGRGAPPPVARVAGDAAALAAADEALAAIEAAKGEGRLAIRVPLDAIAVDHLVRDRIGVADEDMEALMTSIRAHGQRTPIEVVETGGGAYGLISGWRRLAALRALHDETGEDRFGQVLAVIRAPREAGDAYVAMVEENEIRVGLSYYERARIAALAAERGAFDSAEAAIDVLFAAGSRAKRSKIRSFLRIHQEIGDWLRFPAHLPERLGLQVAAALKDGDRLSLLEALATPASSPDMETAALMVAVTPVAPAKTGKAAKPGPKPDRTSRRETLRPGLVMEAKGDRVILSGPDLTPALVARIRAVLLAGEADVE